MTVRYFADSDVYAHAGDSDAGAKQDRAVDPIDRLGSASSLSIGPERLHELYRVTTCTLPRPPSTESAELTVRELGRSPTAAEDSALVLAASALSRAHGVSFRDGPIVEAVRRARAGFLYSEDIQDRRDFAGVRVENPFREQP